MTWWLKFIRLQAVSDFVFYLLGKGEAEDKGEG